MNNIIKKLGITPGPWRYEDRWNENLFGRVVLSEKAEFGRGSITMNVSHDQEKESLNANGMIIAAAPEMLEAEIKNKEDAELALVELEKKVPDINKVYNILCRIGARSSIGLEKATGKTWEEIKELINE